MFKSIKSRTKFALSATFVTLIITTCIGIVWTVRDSSATNADIKQAIDSGHKNSSTELSASVTILEEEKTEKITKQLAVKAAALESAELAEASAKSLYSLEEAIRNFLGNEVGKVGLVYYDISSGNTISINENKTFNAASTIKVPLAMIIYDQVGKGARKETDTLKFSEKNREGGTGILQDNNLSVPITISTLVEDALRFSDNIAANMLLTSMDFDKFKTQEDIKLGITTNHANNEITAQGAFNALKQLNDGANKGNLYYSKIINLMKNTIFNDRISKNIPYPLVAHKIGNYEMNVHDMGIIYTENPYILTIYTNGLINPNATISGISDIIYARQIGN